MRIPADRIHFNDDGTAWLVVDCPPDSAPAMWEQDDKPCDTCHDIPMHRYRNLDPCPDCIDGRHTFMIEVATPEGKGFGEFIDGYRVSIVPGMVLPILQWTAMYRPEHDDDHISLSRDGSHWTLFVSDKASRITLPPAAQPGMWAAKLQVAS